MLSEKMLYIVGLGLSDEQDITLRGLECVRKCSKVYMEAYTSLLSFGLASDGLSKLVSHLFLYLLIIFFFKFCVVAFVVIGKSNPGSASLKTDSFK